VTRPQCTERRRNNATIVTEVALDGEAVYDESATINYRDATAGSEPGTPNPGYECGCNINN